MREAEKICLLLNSVNKRSLYFPKMRCLFTLIGSRVTLILFLNACFACYCIRRQIGFSTNFSCKLVFPNVSQRKIEISANLSCKLVFPNLFTLSYGIRKRPASSFVHIVREERVWNIVSSLAN